MLIGEEVSDGVSHLDIDSIAQQSHAAEADRAVKNSFAFKARQLMSVVTLQVFSATPKDLAAELEELTEAKQKICKQCDDAAAAVRDAVHLNNGGEDDNFDAIVDALKIKKTPLLRSIVDWYVAAGDAAQRHVEALRPIPDLLYLEAEKVVETVKADLDKIGSGWASMTANAHDAPDTAARQFDFIARRNVRSRRAIEAAQNAAAEYDAAAEVTKRITERLKAVRAMLRAMAVEAVTSST